MLFADDCIIEQYGNTPINAVTTTNVAKWHEDNLLKLNTSKTHVMMLTNRQIDTDQILPVISKFARIRHLIDIQTAKYYYT